METIDAATAKRREYARNWYAKNAAHVAAQRAEKLLDAARADNVQQYRREYYAKNSTKAQQMNAARYLANKDARKAYQIAYRQTHTEQLRAADARWRAANPERVKRNKEAWYVANAEKMRELARVAGPKWRAENPDKVNAYASKKRAKRQLRVPGWFGEFDELVAQEASALAIARSAYGMEWHVDHLIPLQGRKASGLHCGLNLQVIPAILNMQKYNKMQLIQLLEWLNHI